MLSKARNVNNNNLLTHLFLWRPFITDLLRLAKIIIVEMYTAYGLLCTKYCVLTVSKHLTTATTTTTLLLLLLLHCLLYTLALWDYSYLADPVTSSTPHFDTSVPCRCVYINNSTTLSEYEDYWVTICRISMISPKDDFTLRRVVMKNRNLE